jgi:hypothetical protein
MTLQAIDGILIAAAGGLIIRCLVGSLVAALVLMEHEFWMLHLIRLPLALHRRLKTEARLDHTTVRALIVAKLERGYREAQS